MLEDGCVAVYVTPTVAWQAVELRAYRKLRPADAFHVTTALVHSATALIADDLELARLTEVQVFLLNDLVAA